MLEQVFKDKDIIKTLVLAIKDKDKPEDYVGMVYGLAGVALPVVIKLPWEDVKPHILAKVDGDAKAIIESSDAEVWWNGLQSAIKTAMQAEKEEVSEEPKETVAE